MNIMDELMSLRKQRDFNESRLQRELQKQAEQHAIETALLHIRYKRGADLLPGAEDDIKSMLSHDGKQLFANPGRLPDAPPEACGDWSEIDQFLYAHPEWGPSLFESLNPDAKAERDAQACEAAGLPRDFQSFSGDQAVAAVRTLIASEEKSQ
jgi:hypothetical protein